MTATEIRVAFGVNSNAALATWLIPAWGAAGAAAALATALIVSALGMAAVCAQALRQTHDPESQLAGEIVHHASLAGEPEIAAKAAVELRAQHTVDRALACLACSVRSIASPATSRAFRPWSSPSSCRK